MARLGYVPALDGIRAVAILLVVSFHITGFPSGGIVGVDLFFVLSGFLITTLLLEERAETGRIRLRAFYIRRVRRLAPALIFMVAVYLVVTTAAGADHLAAAVIGVSYVANIATAFHITNVVNVSLLNPLWSLAQEEQFYLVWPWLLLLLVRSRRLAEWLGVLLVALIAYRAGLMLAGFDRYRVFYGPDTHSDGLVAGALLAAIRVRRGISVGEWAGQVGVGALIPACLLGWQFGGWAVWGQPLFDCAMVLLVAAALSETSLARGLASRPLTWIGERSYSLYLWHVPAFAAVLAVIGSGAVAKPVGFVAAIGAATLSYRFVEQPFRHRRTTYEPPPAALEAT